MKPPKIGKCLTNALILLEGGTVSVNPYSFQTDFTIIHSKDEALTALVHLGYLGFDTNRKKAFIPNYEVSLAYQAALTTGKWKEISKTILKYNDENSLSCAIAMVYFTAPAYYNVVREFPSGKGFADIAFIPRADSGGKPAMIVELKWDKDADSGIRQIKEKRYDGALKGYGDVILLVGINYDKDIEDKKHSCVIEQIKL